ncbi:MAG: thiamine pyrophosphate-binding protein [Deltaproteobacteria bacterium]|nr:thiamine pyrophosphate-binding protein [Deltaproteobacteria bacterium]
MNLITGGEVLVDCLRKQGVRYVFSIIGGQMGTMYDTIGRRDDIDLFIPRCETVTPLMAAGYTATTGIPAASLTTVGAGVVYEVAGLAYAWLNYHPVISLAPQVQSWKMKPHQENLQACNQDEIYFPLTKWNTIVYHWKRIPQMLTRGFREAYTGIPGPVHIDIPVDILFKRGLWSSKDLNKVPMVQREAKIAGVASQIADAVEVLKKSEKALIIVGQGIGRIGRYRNIRALLNQCGLPVVTTRFSSGIMRGSDEAFASAASLFAQTDKGMNLLREADAIVVIGVDPETISLIEKCGWASKPIVQIETDPSALLTCTQYPVHADPVSALSAIIASGIDIAAKSKGWLESFRKIIPELTNELSPADEGINKVISMLGESTGTDDIIVADGAGIAAAAAYILRDAEYRDLFCLDERDMPGVGLPFAIGAAIGNPNARINLICDKESLFAHIRELSPAAQAGVALRIIVADNEDEAVNCADTASVLEGFGCVVRKQSLSDSGIEIPEFRGKAISALVLEPVLEKVPVRLKQPTAEMVSVR